MFIEEKIFDIQSLILVIVYEKLVERSLQCKSNNISVTERVVALLKTYLPEYCPNEEILLEVDSFCQQGISLIESDPNLTKVQLRLIERTKDSSIAQSLQYLRSIVAKLLKCRLRSNTITSFGHVSEPGTPQFNSISTVSSQHSSVSNTPIINANQSNPSTPQISQSLSLSGPSNIQPSATQAFSPPPNRRSLYLDSSGSVIIKPYTRSASDEDIKRKKKDKRPQDKLLRGTVTELPSPLSPTSAALLANVSSVAPRVSASQTARSLRQRSGETLTTPQGDIINYLKLC